MMSLIGARACTIFGIPGMDVCASAPAVPIVICITLTGSAGRMAAGFIVPGLLITHFSGIGAAGIVCGPVNSSAFA